MDNVVGYKPPIATQILAGDGTVIGEFFTEKRYLVPLDAHSAARAPGVSGRRGRRLLRAPRGRARSASCAPSSTTWPPAARVQGGSTITQQVVKSLLLTPQKSYERKIKEIILSVRLGAAAVQGRDPGRSISTTSTWAAARYGVAAAADEYFGKDIADVTLAEAALLAGLPQAPSRYSPFRHWPRAKARQRYVLDRMYDVGFISRDERDAALQRSDRPGDAARAASAPRRTSSSTCAAQPRGAIRPHGPLRARPARPHHRRPTPAGGRRDEPAQRASNELAQRHGNYRGAYRHMDADERDGVPALAAGSVPCAACNSTRTRCYEAHRHQRSQKTSARVSVGPFAGDLCSRCAKEGPPLQARRLPVRVRLEDEERRGRSAALRHRASPPLEGALVALDPTTGYVRAMVGGYDFERSQFNRATQARRQPGSAFKPLVYAAALDRNITPASIIVDEPITYNDNGRVWTPQNFEKRYLRADHVARSADALAQRRRRSSWPIASASATSSATCRASVSTRADLARNLSIALGSAEVTPLELADAYSTFANDGRLPPPDPHHRDHRSPRPGPRTLRPRSRRGHPRDHSLHDHQHAAGRGAPRHREPGAWSRPSDGGQDRHHQ